MQNENLDKTEKQNQISIQCIQGRNFNCFMIVFLLMNFYNGVSGPPKKKKKKIS